MTCAPGPDGFAYASPHEALDAVLSRVRPVGEQTVALNDAFGRVLARPVLADRDSPPSDVSAMDGYAVRAADLAHRGAPLVVVGVAEMGQPAPPMPAGGCLKISTGACVPPGCDGVVPREQVEEHAGHVVIGPDAPFTPGQHIRRRGENASVGTAVAAAGVAVTPPVAAALAAFGIDPVPVFQRVKVAVLTTGDELLPVPATPEPWQIRDSNTATLLAGLANRPWIQTTPARRVADDLRLTAEAIDGAAQHADLVITTGGVSMGDRDHVRDALVGIGGEVLFHKLPIRPGKPCLAGVLPATADRPRPVFVVGLPGNPVAVAVGLGLLVLPIGRAVGGFAAAVPPRRRVTLDRPPGRPLGLWRYLPARLTGDTGAAVLTTRGSGDLAGAAAADGYIEIPPEATGVGPWLFYDATG